MTNERASAAGAAGNDGAGTPLCAPRPQSAPLTTLEVLDAAAASPAYSLWLAAPLADRPGRLQGVAVGLFALMLAVAATLLFRPIRWDLVSALWVLYNLVTPVGIALWARGRVPPGERPVIAKGWGARSLRALPIIVVVMPTLIAFSRLLGAAVIGETLARANPAVADPKALVTAIGLSMLWAVPLGALFTIAATRQGRLRTAGDLARAAFAWIWILVVYELLVEGPLAALRTQMVGTLDMGKWAAAQPLLIRACFFYLFWRLATWLAWGRAPVWRRAATTAVVMLFTLVNLGLMVGLLTQVQFGLGRYLERTSEPARAVTWYERTLITRSNPAIESYLAHRLGLLRYKLGDTERAIDTFRLAQTSHNTNAELTRQSGYYLDRLEEVATGSRVVLEGVETATERRAAYCAPNTLSLVLNYWGRDTSPSAIGEQIAEIGSGTMLSDIRLLVEKAGLELRLVPFATVDDVRSLIDLGAPALLYLPGHVMAVFGYDDRLGTWVTYDTASWDIWIDQPVHEILQTWGDRYFLLGVVVPTDADPALVAAVDARFDPARSLATWHWWLGEEQGGHDADAHYRRALEHDSSFFPALLATNSLRERDWIREFADLPAAVAAAEELLERDHAPIDEIAPPLAYLYHARGMFEETLRLRDKLARFNLLSDDDVHLWAGNSAASLGQWERASALLSGPAPRQGIAAWAFLLAQRELGRTELAATLARDMAPSFSGDELLAIVRVAESLGADEGPAYWEELYRLCTTELAPDVERELHLAEFSLEAIEQGDQARDRRERRQRARRAATIAAALAETETDRTRARDLLTRVGALLQ